MDHNRTTATLPALASASLWLSVARKLHHCNDCGRELHDGDAMVWAHELGVPFCLGCARERDLPRCATPTRRWRELGWEVPV